MRRNGHVVGSTGDHPQRLEVCGHVAVGRRHHRGAPSHHVVTGEQRPTRSIVEREARVIRRVTRRVQRSHRPTVALRDRVAGDHGDVGRERDRSTRLLHLRFGRRPARARPGCDAKPVRVGADVPRLGVRSAMRSERVRRRTGLGAQPRGEWRMIGMAVRHQDRAHPLAVERGGERIAMRIERRPRIDHRDVARPDDVGPGAVIGELGRVLGDDPPHARRDLFDTSVLERVSLERDEVDRSAHRDQSRARTSPTTMPWPRTGTTTVGATFCTMSLVDAEQTHHVDRHRLSGGVRAVGDLVTRRHARPAWPRPSRPQHPPSRPSRRHRAASRCATVATGSTDQFRMRRPSHWPPPSRIGRSTQTLPRVRPAGSCVSERRIRRCRCASTSSTSRRAR